MNLKELMIAASGHDENEMPKSSVVLLNEFWSQNGDREVVDELAIDSPTVEFFAGDGFVQLDLNFGSRHNVDLSLAYEMLSRFRVVENSVGEDEDTIPVTTVVILPTECEGQYYIACINPLIHCLTAESVNGELCVVRMTFPEDSVLLYENEDFEPDIDLEDEE